MEKKEQKNITWETVHNTAERCMWHIFANGLRVLTDWNTNFVYLIDERDKTIEKRSATDFTIHSYEEYLKTVAGYRL